MGYMQLVLIAATALVFTSFVVAQERCRPNEARLPCGRRCEMRCNNAPLPPGCTNCVGAPGCRCINGHARNPHSNECIFLQGCPDTRCGVGEIEGPCGRQCEGTCANHSRPATCRPHECGTRGCLCDLEGGFVRSRAGNCIRWGRC